MPLLLAGALAAAPAHAADRDPLPTSIPSSCETLEGVAHRGLHLAADIDENTVAAFEAAAALGDSVELDVWPDSENTLWVFHDQNIARATGLPDRLIDSMTSAEVAELTYAKAGTPLLLLSDALAWLQAHPEVPAYIEPKRRLHRAAGAEQTTHIPAVIAQGILDVGREPNTWITAYNDDLREDRPLHPAYPTVRLFDKTRVDDPRDPVPDPAAIAAAGFDTVGLRARDMTPELVARFHEVGLRVQGSNARHRRAWRATILGGADGQLTDDPSGVDRYCRNRFTAPTITRFWPRRAAAPASVVVRGTGLASTTEVRMRGRSVRFTVRSNRVLRVVVGARVPRRSRIMVTNRWGSTVSEDVFRRQSRR